MALWAKKPDSVDDVWLAYRQVDPRFPPLWYGGGSVTRNQDSGRWHEKGKGVAQYLALSSPGAWSERIRYESIRDEDRRKGERRNLWELQVVEHDIADLSTFDRYLACGLKPELAIGPHENCWPLADDLRDADFRGVLSPSAAYDVAGAVNLTLFGERMEAYVAIMPRPREQVKPDFFLPAILGVQEGAPTEQAMKHTCYRSGHHQTFAAWAQAVGYP